MSISVDKRHASAQIADYKAHIYVLEIQQKDAMKEGRTDLMLSINHQIDIFKYKILYRENYIKGFKTISHEKRFSNISLSE